MNINFLKAKSLDEVQEDIRDRLHSYIQNKDILETVSLSDSLHRYCGRDLYAESDLPPFDRSTVDGYAVKSKDVGGASESVPSVLELIGTVKMGEEIHQGINSGQCMYVPTGGMLPDGTDGMIMIEDTESLDAETIMMHKPIKKGENINYKGDDIQEGDVLIQSGKKMGAYDIAMLAGMGVVALDVVKAPKFSVISTGDEIIDIHEPMTYGKIRDINGYGISSWIEERGGEVMTHEIVSDHKEGLRKAVEEQLKDVDAIILSGGSSMGAKDFTKDIIESFEEGQVLLHGLAVKPGKPTIVGLIGDKLIFGLPGHPVSALMVCQHTVGIFMEEWFNTSQTIMTVKAILQENIHGAPGRDLFQMVKLISGDGPFKAVPIYGKSGLITTLAHGSGWIRIGRDREGLFAGDMVDVQLIQEVRL